jgi:hypothetical protein
VAKETSRGWRIAKEQQKHKIDVVVALGMAALIAAQHGSIALVPPPTFYKIIDSTGTLEKIDPNAGSENYRQNWNAQIQAESRARVAALPSTTARPRRWV